MTTVRHKGGWATTEEREARICRWCKKPVTDPRRSTFCSPECVEQHKLRSNPQFVARKLNERDHGVCAICRIDTVALQKEQTQLRRQHQPTSVPSWWFGRRRWWDADHIVPVIEGGGLCGLDNYRTLCIKCHQEETKKLAARRAEARRSQQKHKEQDG